MLQIQSKSAIQNTTIKKSIALFMLTIIFGFTNATAQSKTITTDHFDKIIVSPHIEVNFKKGDQESVFVENISVPIEKLNVEVVGKTLRIYLDGAKMITKSEKVDHGKWKGRRSIYKGTIVTATITYKNIEELSLRGEETFICESPLQMEKFKLKIYGESRVFLNEVILNNLQTTIYGESYLEIKKGSVQNQKFTAYGESKINSLEVNNKNTKITAYGESSFRLNTSDNLKVTAYVETVVAYRGNPNINKGIIIGDATIQSIQ